jgi:sulfatase maturation enzyme AslB (radical SAM superfamily)
MKTLTLIVTDACNLKCSYCFQQRSPKRMTREIAERSVDLLFQHDDNNLWIGFFGGEPLLEFDLIKHVVHYSRQIARNRRKQIRFAITTNGMLIDKAAFGWLNRQKFAIKLSVDGFRPEHEIERGQGTGGKLSNVLDMARTKYDCRVRTHTVVTPSTVDYLAETIEFLYAKGIRDFEIGPEFSSPWPMTALKSLELQYQRLTVFAKRYYDQWERLPFELFTTVKRDGGFKCDIGCSKGSFVAPDGEVYGCTFHLPMWRKHGDYPEDFRLSWGSVDHLHQLGVTSPEFKAAVDQVNASPYQARVTERHTDLMKCSECPINHSCDACFVPGFQYNRGPLYIPEHICHMNVMRMKFGEELNAYIEKRRIRRQPDVEKMQLLLSKGHVGQSRPIPIVTSPIKLTSTRA